MSSFEDPNNPSGLAQKVEGAARTAAEKVKTKAEAATSQVRRTAADIAAEQKGQIADRISHVGSAMHRTAESLQEDDPNIGWFTEQASDRLERAANYVRSCNLDTLRNDASDLARRHPLVFFGGMFVLGTIAGALVRAGTRSVTTAGESEGEEPIAHDFLASNAAGMPAPETF
jgi:gas vesicle protein